MSADGELEISAADLVFCDSIALSMVTSNRNVHYQLVSADCIRELSMLLTIEI